MSTITLTRNTTLPDSSAKTDFHNLIDTATATLDDFKFDGAVTINDSGAAVDFRVESDTEENMFFLDASADSIGMGTNAPTGVLDIYGDSEDVVFNMRAYSATISHSPVIRMYKSATNTRGTTTQTIDNDTLGEISFFGVDSSPTARQAAYILARQNGAAGASNVGCDIEFFIDDGGGVDRVFSLMGTSGDAHPWMIVGATIGTDADANRLDDATHGSSSTPLYIGNHIIAVSDAGTGGTGSAGAGNQYVELKIGANTYKVLHDGTV